MKKIIFIAAFSAIAIIQLNAQNGASINTTGTPADPSAILDISSVNSGILIPRMTEVQKNSISTPATGLMIYQTDAVKGFWYYDGTQWIQAIGPAGPTGSQGATGLLSAGTSAGNTPYWDGAQWVISSSNLYNNGGSIGIGTSSPNAGASLDLGAVSKGFLINRMTTTERNAISNPVDGMQIYNTSSKCFEFYADGVWQIEHCALFKCGVQSVTFTYQGSTVTYGTVEGENSTCWLDRNLGASQVAAAYNDINGYGDLFQWGRGDDGHQLRTSSTTTTLSTTNTPGHSKFIVNSSSPYDWRSPQNNQLWQGVYGANNPCPSGWRVPTNVEIDAERSTFSPLTYVGAYNTPLKWPCTDAARNYDTGIYPSGATQGDYWTSTVENIGAYFMVINSGDAFMYSSARGYGMAIRCVKDY